ncbi:MAG: tetratricopeptide repeat protein [Tenuifilaceae bacterium]
MKNIKHIILITLIFIGVSSSAQLNKAYFFYQGQRLISQDKYTEAIRYLNTLIEIDSTLAEGWFLRGAAKYYLNDFHGSINDFSKSIKNNPLLTQAYHYRAIVESQLSRYKDAIKDLDFALELRPNDQEILYTRGATYIQTMQYNLAIEDYNKVIRYSPTNLGAWLNRGIARLYLNDTISAIEDYSQAIKLNPFYAESYSRRGRVYYEKKEFDVALFDINQSILLDSTSTINYFIRGLIRNSMNKPTQAIEDFDKVLSIDPNNSLSLYNRALIKSNTGALNSALEDYNRLVKLNPKNVLVFYNRASVNFDLGKYKESIDDYTSAISLFPDFANAYINRSVAKSRIGNTKGAEEDYNIANQKIQKYKTSSQASYIAMADTSNKLKSLLAFNTDFGEGFSKINLKNDISLPTGFLPFLKLQLIDDKSKTAFRNYRNKFIDSLNNRTINGYQFAFAQSITSSNSMGEVGVDKNAINKHNAEKHFYDGMLYSISNKFNQAVSEYQKALSFDPSNQIIALNLAVEEIEMTRFIEQFSGDLGSISFEMGGITNKKEDKKEIINSYSEIISSLKTIEKKLPDLAVIPYNIGNAYLFSENLDNAIAEYNLALRIEPNFAEAWFNRGMVYLIKGEKQKGCLDISKSGELGINQAYSIIQKFCK